MEKHLSLSQLAAIVKEVISLSFPEAIWVKAEISDLNENRSGHCYLELIEKDVDSENIIARFRAIIWDRTYRMLKPYFERTASIELKTGLTVLLKVKPEFSELYGVSLIVYDIDPSYTLGNLELQRAMVIQQLLADGVFEMNKQLDLPLVPQRIAVISSDTAAGYQDFVHHLQNNDYGFRYEIKLFKAYMQGEEAEPSIIEALDKINEKMFDVVVITRGGGSRTDLACFDRYLLNYHVCQFPLPVISAVGHERDVTVLDMVAHTRVKTPTAAAHFILERTIDYWQQVSTLYEQIVYTVKEQIDEQEQQINTATKAVQNIKQLYLLIEQQFMRISEQIHRQTVYSVLQFQQRLSLISQQIRAHSFQRVETSLYELTSLSSLLIQHSKTVITKQEQQVAATEKLIGAYNPRNILKKGYSITQKEGKSLLSSQSIKAGDELKTILFDGEVISIVK